MAGAPLLSSTGALTSQLVVLLTLWSIPEHMQHSWPAGCHLVVDYLIWYYGIPWALLSRCSATTVLGWPGKCLHSTTVGPVESRQHLRARKHWRLRRPVIEHAVARDKSRRGYGEQVTLGVDQRPRAPRGEFKP
ncbi:hypothetical protein BKA56DRAFT_237178 [Ilyonectria sp. MPI-CAGE-AT-0026]|nr:hypothetical protein BKA56DRAFT_237178 [Ilyonectria sp. MPI-CAGE-AT-0026]